MSNINNSPEVLSASAVLSFRSASFIAATIACLLAVLLDGYLIWRYWGKVPDYVPLVLSLPIGVQLVYQWFRVRQSCAKAQELASQRAHQETSLDPALQLAVRGMLEVLFVSYGIIFIALSLIGALLGKLIHG